MATSGDVLRHFYRSVVQRDFVAARQHLHDDMVFEGLFETYPNPDAYLTTLAGLMQITVRLDVKAVIAEADDVAVFFELETKDPVPATTLVAEWHQLKGNKIIHARSAFDGRPFAAMFAGRK